MTMMIATVSALTCPACGGPLNSHSPQCCRFCGVALVTPLNAGDAYPAGEPATIHREIARLRGQLRLDPTRAETHRRLGHAYHALGLADDAVRALTVAVGLAPEAIPARLELATLLASQSAAGVPDAFPAAMRHVQSVLALEPESSNGRLLLARLLTQRGQYGEARATLTGISALPSEEIRRRSVWVTLAEAADHERRGDRRSAVAAWRRVAADAPDLARPAIWSFLSRTRSISPTIADSDRRQRSRLPQRVLRLTLVIVLTALAGLALNLPWPVLIATAGLALLLTRSGWRTGRMAIGRGTTSRSGAGSSSPDLTRLLREAELAATHADLASRRRIDWADNLVVALPRRGRESGRQSCTNGQVTPSARWKLAAGPHKT